MGFLSRFTKTTPTLLRLPAGSFTVNREGVVLVDTLPSSFPAALVTDIARQVLAVFHAGAAAQLPLSEISISYPSLKIIARELRGGAIVFLSPQAPYSPANQS
jgi:hypothetical protein